MTWNSRLPLIWVAIIFTSLLISLGILYPERLVQLHTHWTTPDDLDLGYLLLIVFFYFSYKNISHSPSEPNFYLLPAAILISSSFFLGQALDIKTLFFISVALSFPFFTSIILGLKKAKELLIPWSILMMAMPFWYLATPVLQGITVKIVSELASLMSLTVLVEGNYFTISTGVVHVAGGCSGLKYFMTSITLALISSAMNKRVIRFTIASVLIAALLAMLGNWIRVLILLLVAYYQGIEHPLMADHDTLGWIVFACVMLPWLLIDKRLDRSSFEPITQTDNACKTESLTVRNYQYRYLLALSLCLVLFFTTQALIRPSSTHHENQYQVELPKDLHGFRYSTAEPKNWSPNYPQANASISGKYFLGNSSYDIYVLNYLFGSEAEMANRTNTIFDKNKWALISETSWQNKQDTPTKIRIALGKAGREYRVVYYWYKHGDTFANSIFSSKLAQLQNMYKGIDNAQLIALSKTCDIQCQNSALPDKETQALIAELNKRTTLTESP